MSLVKLIVGVPFMCGSFVGGMIVCAWCVMFPPVVIHRCDTPLILTPDASVPHEEPLP